MAALLPDERIDAALAPLAGASRVLLAVSGGPDSTALLLMATAWAARRGGPALFSATVDHGLRPEGAREAEAVGALAKRLGAPHAVLCWIGDKPETRLQERAREARYALLAEEARRVGAEAVVTAHHLDDQAETVLFRLLRGSGIAGLAGMASVSQREGLRLVRPLLGLSKAEMIAHCEASGVPFVRDPSNENPRFARARLRALAPALAAEGLDAPALARLARRAARAEAALRRQTAEAEARLGLVSRGECDAAALLAEPDEIALRLLAAAIERIEGRAAGLEQIEALAEGLRRAGENGKSFGANVAGALVVARAGKVTVQREPPRSPAGELERERFHATLTSLI